MPEYTINKGMITLKEMKYYFLTFITSWCLKIHIFIKLKLERWWN